MNGTRYAALPHVGLTEIYPVGVLLSLQIIGRCLTVRGISREHRIRSIRFQSRYIIHTTWRHTKGRDWNALRKSLNGYLAEPYDFPAYMTRCGHGWTTKRAINDLLRHEETCRRTTSEESKS